MQIIIVISQYLLCLFLGATPFTPFILSFTVVGLLLYATASVPAIVVIFYHGTVTLFIIPNFISFMCVGFSSLEFQLCIKSILIFLNLASLVLWIAAFGVGAHTGQSYSVTS